MYEIHDPVDDSGYRSDFGEDDVPLDEKYSCDECCGTGEVTVRVYNAATNAAGYEPDEETQPCSHCDGTGIASEERLDHCIPEWNNLRE